MSNLPAETKPRIPRDEYLALQPLAKADPQQVINHYLQGKTSPEIAAEYKVTKQALSYWLLKHAEDEWKTAQVVKAITLRDQAEDALGTALDTLDLSRAREQLKSAQWTLERVLRRIYGTDRVPDQVERVAINIQFGHESSAASPVVAVQQKQDDATD